MCVHVCIHVHTQHIYDFHKSGCNVKIVRFHLLSFASCDEVSHFGYIKVTSHENIVIASTEF